MGIARAGLEELLLDYKDFLRQRDLPLWPKEHPIAQEIRKLACVQNRSYVSYRTYIEEQDAEVAANTVICLIHQTNFLLDRQLRQLGAAFLKEGGFTERLYRSRSEERKKE